MLQYGTTKSAELVINIKNLKTPPEGKTLKEHKI
jgi:hypothetical protein